MQEYLYIDNLNFAYETNPEPLFESVNLQLHQGWTGVVGPNGSGKSTLLKLICGRLHPHSGKIRLSGLAVYCEQRTDSEPHYLNQLIESTDKQAYKIKNALQLDNEWLGRWQTLSHGERKRCQIATALFQNPSILAIDEPSNHLDVYSKNVLFSALKKFHGVGLLVSHDRDLLDNLCDHTIFLTAPKIQLFKCEYSTAASEMKRQNETLIEQFKTAKKEEKKLKQKAHQQREKARQADKLKSKRNLNPRDHDAKAKKDMARLTGKDAVQGRIYNRVKSQLDKASDKKNSIVFSKTSPIGIFIDGRVYQTLFPLFIKPDKIKLGNEKKLIISNLSIEYGEKIGIVGINGSGKSTFVQKFIKDAEIHDEKLIYIPQEIPLERSKSMITRIHEFDTEKKGRLMSIISRLGSDPEHVLTTPVPSPGEIRKLMLAEGIMQNPGLIIMDEPTNHMDLTSMECIETALNECGCAQLLVSHDLVFLKNVASRYWIFENEGENIYKIAEKDDPEF